MSVAALSLQSVLSAIPGAPEYTRQEQAPFWVGNLERLLHSAATECNWTAAGHAAFRDNIVSLVEQRLRAERILAANPAVLARPLPVRFAIAGLARSGTTLLHRLLACDPDVEYLPTWQAFDAVPPESGRDYRLQASTEMIEQLLRNQPEIMKLHPLDPMGAEEEIFLLQHSFASMLFAMNAPLPSYSQWLNEHDHTEAYRFAFDLLRLNEWSAEIPAGRPRVMKSPQFLLDLAVLDRLLPDTTIIQTHRDPTDLVGSYCSIYANTRRSSDASFDPHRLGSERLAQLLHMLERSAAVRSASQRERAFVDVHYAAVVKDPLAVIEQLYDAAGVDLTPQARQAMERWIKDHPQGHAGRHEYNLADYGLTRNQIEQAFESYLDRYQVECDA